MYDDQRQSDCGSARYLAQLGVEYPIARKVTAIRSQGDLGHQYIIDGEKYCHGAIRFANRMASAVHRARTMTRRLQSLLVAGLMH